MARAPTPKAAEKPKKTGRKQALGAATQLPKRGLPGRGNGVQGEAARGDGPRGDSIRGGEMRERILEVAGRMLHEVGPDGLRLQEIARELGISHPLILHHFGNRAGLVHAVVERSMRELESDILATLITPTGEPPSDPVALIERTFRAFHDQGHARLLAWLSLSGVSQMERTSKLGDIAQVVHAMRSNELAGRGQKAPPFEDSAFVVMLACFALLGDAMCGQAMREGSPLGKADPTGARFRTWLAARLVTMLEVPSSP
jgi:AcrR family transcriptional regulator